jgi:hypothetical protein
VASKPNNWIRLATLLFVGAYTALTTCVLRSNQELNGLTREAVEATTRPYIKIILDPSGLQFGPNGADIELQLPFTVENYGKLPTIVNVQQSLRWQGGSHVSGPKSFSSTGMKFLFPGEPSEAFKAILSNISRGELMDMKSNSTYLLAAVMVKYSGHRVISCTRFRLSFNGDTPTLSDRDAYNDSAECNTAD